MPRNSIKFAVADNNGHCAATWKCWTQGNKGDVYLACEQLDGTTKLSMHATGHWHVAFDATQQSKIFDEIPPSRFLGQWNKPKPLCAGLTLASRVRTPCYAVTMPISSLPDKVARIPAAPKDHSVEVAIFLADKEAEIDNWPCSESMNTKLVGSFEIGDGGKVWIIYHMIPLVEPIIHPSPEPTYFKGKDEQDLFRPDTRIVTWAAEPDGSIAFFEAPTTAKKIA